MSPTAIRTRLLDPERLCLALSVDDLHPKTWGSYWDHFGKRLVELIRIRPGSSVLDVGTGGGASLYPAVQRTGPRGKVIGIEVCEGCLKRTSAEIERCGISNASLLRMDARSMTFENESFDFVLSGFIGWDDYFDFESCRPIADDVMMSEIYRVLRSGGRVGISGWAVQDESSILRDLLYEYLPSDSHHRKGVAGWSHRETPEGWQAILSNAGLVKIKTFVERYVEIYPSEDAWWSSSFDGDWKKVAEDLARSGVITIQALRERAFEMLSRYKRADGIHQVRDAVLAIGTKH